MDTISPQTSAKKPYRLARTNAQTFPHFRKLPLELRFKIYAFAILPRLVPIFAYPVPLEYEADDIGRLLDHEPNFASMPVNVAERFFTSPQLVTPLLHVDSESRSFVLSRNFQAIESVKDYRDNDFKKMFLCRHGVDGDHRGNRRPDFMQYMRVMPIKPQEPSLVDAKSDVFFLEDPRLQQPEFVLSTIDATVRWIGPYLLDNLKRLAMPYYTWRKASLYLYLHILTEFTALEELYISFLGCEEQSPGSDWASSVNGFNPHFEDMEKHILGDFEELIKKFPDWKRPVIKFVKNKSALRKELGLRIRAGGQ